MGIRGMTQLIKRHCPDQIQQTTIDSFRGKTLALDGNLLMQRFHHGSDGSPPLKLWYRFLKSLRTRHDITPICIFDGRNRLPQKQKELEKRSASRLLLAQRARLAQERSDRIDAIALTFSQFNALPSESRQLIQEDLQKLLSSKEDTSEPQETVTESREVSKETPTEVAAKGSIEAPVKDMEKSSIANLPESAKSVANELRGLIVMSRELPEFTPTKLQQRHLEVEQGIFENVLNPSTPSEQVEDVYQVLERLQLDSAVLSLNYTKRAQSIDQNEYARLDILIKAMGLPLLKVSDETPHEAEALGAALVTAGLADVVVSEDSDVLLYDVAMLRNVTGYKLQPTLLNGKNIREALGLDQRQFIELGLLCGSDFADRIPKLGPVTAYKEIKEHGSIEAVLQADKASDKPKYLIPDLDNYLHQILAAREVFDGPPCIPSDSDALKMQPEDPNLERILKDFDLQDSWIPDGSITSSPTSYFNDRPASF